jgi:cytochrome c
VSLRSWFSELGDFAPGMVEKVIYSAISGSCMFRKILFATIALLFLTPAVVAGEFGTREEAVAMVKRVQDKFLAVGAEVAFAVVTDKNTPEFHDRDLYPFIYDMTGKCVAHGARPVLVGKNLIGLKDQDGKLLIQGMLDIAKTNGSGWYDYKWPNPTTSKIEDKSSYVEKMGDYMVGVGVYR